MYEWIFNLLLLCTTKINKQTIIAALGIKDISNQLNRLMRRQFSRKPTESLRQKIDRLEILCKELENTDLVYYESDLFCYKEYFWHF